MNYKSITVFIIGLAIGAQLSTRFISSNSIANYLFMGQLNLDNHLATVDQTEKEKIFFLGSSAIAGQYIPLSTTLADYFSQLNPQYQAYNLAAYKSTLLDTNIILNIYKEKKPKVVILGIDPSVIGENQTSLFAKVHADNAIPELQHSMDKFLRISFKDKLEIATSDKPLPPTALQAWWKTSLIQLRHDFWGPLFYKKLFNKPNETLIGINSPNNTSWILIDTFIKIAKENNIAPIIFIEPILESTYAPEDLAQFIYIMKQKSAALNFTLFDYSALLESTHDFFYDFVHLTPKGYEKLAHQITQDLLINKVITEKVL